MRITPSNVYTYFNPSPCELRLFLDAQGEEEKAPRSAFEEVIMRMGDEHERQHLGKLENVIDLSGGTFDERIARTAGEIDVGDRVIYQGVLKADVDIGGKVVEVLGVPDFMIPDGEGGHIIRDSKMARRINERDHPEIFLQLGIYGWLFGQSIGRESSALQVHSGSGEVVDVSYIGDTEVLGLLDQFAAIKTADSEPYSPPGWSKCSHCCFKHYCWPRAEESRSVALVPSVDQGMVLALRAQGVNTMNDLLANFNEDQLAELQRPWGSSTRRVGNSRAAGALREAKALASGEEIMIAPPELPDCDNWVAFDLEGLPPQLDELDKVYLWGMQVFGTKPGEFQAAVAGFGENGDREGWEDFLAKSKAIFDEYGDLPFVHWAPYEKSKIKTYIERYGDVDGIAARVKDNLLDLLPVTKKSMALPLPSYSLKVIERHVGFERTQDEFGGDWSIAKYIEAVETEDEDQRNALMADILKYNREDLEATWAVLDWLRTLE
jgi:predicted RecB family nuclease